MRFEGGVYQHATPVRVSLDRLVAVGTPDDWWPGLTTEEPTVFAPGGVDAQVALAVRGSTTDSLPGLGLSLFVRGDGTIPAAWCPHVAVD